MLTPQDEQRIEDLIAEKLDIMSALRDMSDEAREQIARDLEPFLYSRQEALRKPKNTYTPRVTMGMADINVDETGNLRGHAGPTLPRWIDFVSGAAYLDDEDYSIVHVRPSGGGGDCMFNFMVSSCWATEITAGRGTQGQVFTTLSGCTFKMYSTVATAVLQAATDFASTTPAVIFVCSGTYAESVLFAASQYVQIFGAGMNATIIGGTSGASQNPTFRGSGGPISACHLWLSNLTLKTNHSTSGTASSGISTTSTCEIRANDVLFQGNTGPLSAPEYSITHASGAATFWIMDCKATGYGFDISGTASGHVRNVYFSSNTVGVIPGDDCTIEACTFEGCTTGISISGANDGLYTGNHFINGTAGIAILTSTVGTDITISNNTGDGVTTFIDVSAAPTTTGALDNWNVHHNRCRGVTTFLSTNTAPFKNNWHVFDNTLDSASSGIFFKQGGSSNNTFWPGFKHWGNFVDNSSASSNVPQRVPVEGTLNQLFTAGVFYIDDDATATPGLVIGCGGFIYLDGTTRVSVASNQTVELTGSTTHYVEVTQSGGTGTLSSNTTAFTAGSLRCFTVVTAAGAYSSHVDWLGILSIPGSSGATGTTADHVHTGTGDGGGTIQPDIFKYPVPTTITVASGVLTPTQSYHLVAGEGGLDDTVTDIVAGANGQELVLQFNGSHQITIEHVNAVTPGNAVFLDGGSDLIRLAGGAAAGDVQQLRLIYSAAALAGTGAWIAPPPTPGRAGNLSATGFSGMDIGDAGEVTLYTDDVAKFTVYQSHTNFSTLLALAAATATLPAGGEYSFASEDANRSVLIADTFGGASSQNFIGCKVSNGAVPEHGSILLIKPADDTHTLVMRHLDGGATTSCKFQMSDAQHLSLTETTHVVVFRYDTAGDSGNGAWVELLRSIPHAPLIVSAIDPATVSTSVPYTQVGPLPQAGYFKAAYARCGGTTACGATAQIADVHLLAAANANTTGIGTTIFTTKPTINNTEMYDDSATFATAAFARGDYLLFFNDQQGTGLTEPVTITLEVRYT